MPDTTVTNWFGDIVSHPKVVVEAKTADDIAAILKNPAAILLLARFDILLDRRSRPR